MAQARAHYAAYSVQRTDRLRVITLNTDLCKCYYISTLKQPDTEYVTQGTGMVVSYQDVVTMLIVYSANWFNYINLSHPDTSGMLRFLTDELQDAEDQGDRGMSLAVPLLYVADHFHKFGSWVTFSAAGMGQMHWRHQVIFVGVIDLTHYFDELISSI